MIFISFVFVWGSLVSVNCEINNTREIQQELFGIFKDIADVYNDVVINFIQPQELVEESLRFKRNSLTEQRQMAKGQSMAYSNTRTDVDLTQERKLHDLDENQNPAIEKMNFISTSFVNFIMNCHEINPANLIFGSKKKQGYAMFTIYDFIYGGTIKNDEGTIIANWAEIPSKYMKDKTLSMIFVKPAGSLTMKVILPQIKDLNFRSKTDQIFSSLEFPKLHMNQTVSLPKYFSKMGVSDRFSDDNDNQLEQTSEFNMECEIIPHEFKNETNAFLVPSSFMFVVLNVSNDMPLVFGKLSVPEMEEPEAEEITTCKVPYTEHGYVVDILFNDTLSHEEDFPDSERVKVVCEDGYHLDHNITMTCTKRGWDSDFPKCIKWCLLSKMQSYSTDTSCKIGTDKVDCTDLVTPNMTATVECKSRYINDSPGQKVFKCQENGEWNGTKHECKSDCGRIISDAHGLPWHAPVYRNNLFICGGTIISEYIIYTSVSCLKEYLIEGAFDKIELRVVLGSSKKHQSPDAILSWGEIQNIKVNTIEISSFSKDVAVLSLESAIIYRNHIINICSKDNSVTVEENQLPSKGLIAGFGSTKEGYPNDDLKETTLPILNLEECNKAFIHLNEPWLTKDQFCAPYDYDRAIKCIGNLGSGLGILDQKSRKYYLHGIISNSDVNCIKTNVAIFTKVNSIALKQKKSDSQHNSGHSHTNSIWSWFFISFIIFILRKNKVISTYEI